MSGHLESARFVSGRVAFDIVRLNLPGQLVLIFILASLALCGFVNVQFHRELFTFETEFVAVIIVHAVAVEVLLLVGL